MVKVFCERIKELRLEKGLNQEQLANILGIGKASVSDWETGKSEPVFSNVILLADFFDVSIDYLAGRKDYWLL